MRARSETTRRWDRVWLGGALCACLLSCSLDRSPLADGNRGGDDESGGQGASAGTGGVGGTGATSGASGDGGTGGVTGGTGGNAADGGTGGATGGTGGATGGTGGNAADGGVVPDGGAPPATSCKASTTMACDCMNGPCPACPGGGCSYFCFTGTCTAKCPSGDCQLLCSPSASCNVDCGGGEVINCALCTSPAGCLLICGQTTMPSLIGCFG